MKLFFATLSILTILFLFSCQKEVDFSNGNGGNGGGGGGTSGTRLVKTVTKSGSDSAVSEYGYNSSDKIISFKVSGAVSGQSFDTRITYIRNSSGIIQKQILKDIDLIANGIDSIVTIVNYDA